MKTLVRLCVLLIFILTACSPVKQVLKNPTYFKEVADSVVKRGYCVNETLIINRVDYKTIIIDSTIHDSSFVRSLQSVVGFDTTFPTGTRVTIDSGKIKVYCKQEKKIITQTNTVTQSIRDRKLEEILKAENTALNNLVKEKEHACKEKEIQIGELKNKVASLTIKIYVFIIAIVLYVIYKLYGKVKLPF